MTLTSSKKERAFKTVLEWITPIYILQSSVELIDSTSYIFLFEDGDGSEPMLTVQINSDGSMRSFLKSPVPLPNNFDLTKEINFGDFLLEDVEEFSKMIKALRPDQFNLEQ